MKNRNKIFQRKDMTMKRLNKKIKLENPTINEKISWGKKV